MLCQALEARLQDLEELKSEQQLALKDAALEHEAVRKDLRHEKEQVGVVTS